MADFSRVPGLSGYQQQVALNDQQSMQGLNTLGSLLNLKKGQMEMSAMQDNLARQKRIRDALTAQQMGQVAPPAMGGVVGSPGQSQGAGGAGRALAAKLNQTADIYEQNGDIDRAIKIREQAQKLLPELKDEQVRMGPEGKPVVVRNYKDGSTEISPFNPMDKTEYENFGGHLVPKSALTGVLNMGGAMGKTATPESLMTDARARSEGALNRAQQLQIHNTPKPVFNIDAGGWIAPPAAGVAPGGVVPVPGISKPMTEFQGKSAGYGARAAAAHEILNAVGDGGKVQPGYIKRIAEAVPFAGEGLGTLANITQSAPQQQVEQAQRDFVNAVLRQESGAAISQGEFDNAKKQYFPQPGDTEAVVLQKKRNREQAISGFAGSTSPVGVRNIQGAREKTQAIFEAHKAIKAGADKAAVLQRLQSMGITDSGIK